MNPVSYSALIGSACIAGAAWGAIYYATYAVRSQLLGPTIWRGDENAGAVALTFDDGPAESTPEILEILAAHDVPATFFMIGREVERRPTVARAVAAAGHEIGNHSYTHPIYLYCTAHRTRWELRRAQEAIANVTGVVPLWVRPPCGVRTRAYFRAACELDLVTVQWTVAGFDWKRRNASDIARTVTKALVPGAIILLHDGDSSNRRDRRETAAALPLIISGARARGWRFVPLVELIGEAARALRSSDFGKERR
ncbi:polysaccharide deacetylase family protein [Pyrinomonas sp.]|uniref:polysaccharide deacetylase family protein n=1 Tax=Pyrinomonas sp. TaxID=2080306 RepID=UPI003318FE60